jgi:hypothetical protein
MLGILIFANLPLHAVLVSEIRKIFSLEALVCRAQCHNERFRVLPMTRSPNTLQRRQATKT